MDIALACRAGGPGLIPTIAVVKSSYNIQMNFLPFWSKVVGQKSEGLIIGVDWHFQNIEKILAAPSMGKHAGGMGT